ncbi:poly(ethylene terephthalate) hydrolase family protein [Nocardia crassostreae]|uniref:poly(ethylene terephthalate) hydrolase family protein n=1 Tax=Nocardia crassostreae TaxID=53428 RepID=UPI0012F7E903|nr:hypothetical protein [Nocardia crassostreae]
MRNRLGKSLVSLVAAIAGSTVIGAGAHADTPAPGNLPTGAIESTYFEPGPWAVTEQAGFGCCDSAGSAFDIWYPSELGAGVVRHPIITWGDGTWAHPYQYRYLLSHLASWGFVVIAPDNTNTGTGEEMLDAVEYLVGRAADPASPFHGKLDTGAVGAMGHSQGASGALNAFAHSGGAIRTAVTIELVGQLLCPIGPIVSGEAGMSTCADPQQLGSGSIFYINGSGSPISPTSQSIPWPLGGIQSAQGYYDATPEAVEKVRATLNGPNHNDIQGGPDYAGISAGRVNGVYGFLSYATAWFMDRLRGDALAHSAFVAGSGELFAQTANWSEPRSNITR